VHDTLENLRDRYQGMWLLIRLDGSEAEEGTLLAAHESPEVVDQAFEKHFQASKSSHQPLYVTYSLLEGQEVPAVAL
jgi:hypothetical protein